MAGSDPSASSRVRTAIGIVLLAAFLATATAHEYLQILARDYEQTSALFASLPDRAVPLYPRFLERVAERTSAGQRVAILFPDPEWGRGYSYAYYRASYFLIGREVIPLVDPSNARRLDRLSGVDVLAVWGMDVAPPGFEEVWRGEGGKLLRRTR